MPLRHLPRARSVLGFLATVCAVAGLLVVVPPTEATAGTGETSKLQLLTPHRIFDSRESGKIEAQSSVVLDVTGEGGTPPSGVSAVVLNVTAYQPESPGYVQVYPTGQSSPGAFSNLNVDRTGETIAVQVTAPVGQDGTITLYSYPRAHLIVDIFGYFTAAPSSSDGRYQAMAPTRVLDSRTGQGMPPPANPGNTVNCTDFSTWAAANEWFWRYYDAYGDVAGLDGDDDLIPCETLSGAASSARPQRTAPPSLGAGGAVSVDVDSVIPVSWPAYSAVALNVTMTETAAPGYVQVGGGSGNHGAWSNVNADRSGQTIANLVIVPAGSDGRVSFFTSAGTHLVVDVVGYFTSASAASSDQGLFVPVAPSRLQDTRSGPRVADGGQLQLQPGGHGGVPASGASAVYFSVVADQTTNPGFVQMFPTGQAAAGSSSTLNVEGPGQTIANASIGTIGNAGQVSLYASASTHLIADVFGFFTGAGYTPPAENPLLAGLTVAADNTSVPYNRDEWQHWIDADGDCLDTRAEVLVIESLVQVTFSSSGCTVASGQWVDPWSGSTWTAASDVDIDHHVALQNAHVSGGWAWDAATKRAFANDLVHPEHLNAMEDGLNAAKGSSSPAAWRPPLASTWCEYAEGWISVKTRWDLTVSQPEYDALEELLATC